MSGSAVAMLAVPPESVSRGFSSAAPLRWLDDDGIVHRAIGAKRSHPPEPYFWPRLAVLAQVCLAIARAGDKGVDNSLLTTGRRLATGLATQLPPPGPIAFDPRYRKPPWSAPRRAALPIADVFDCAHDLAVALADSHPPHDEDLADLVDDTLIVLDVYGHAFHAVRCERNHRRTAVRHHGRGPP